MAFNKSPRSRSTARCPRVSRESTLGFTLIEVMAALVIVSLGMMAVIQAVSQVASNSAYLREKTIAHLVAMNRVTELRLAPQAPPTGENSGEVEMAGRRWRWSTQVSATSLATMRRIDVSVAPVEEGKATLDNSNQLAVITGFYGDKIAPPGTVTALFDAPPAAPGTGQPGVPGAPTPPTKPTPAPAPGG